MNLRISFFLAAILFLKLNSSVACVFDPFEFETGKYILQSEHGHKFEVIIRAQENETDWHKMGLRSIIFLQPDGTEAVLSEHYSEDFARGDRIEEPIQITSGDPASEGPFKFNILHVHPDPKITILNKSNTMGKRSIYLSSAADGSLQWKRLRRVSDGDTAQQFEIIFIAPIN